MGTMQDMLEITLIFIVSILTMIFNPPIPLLAIPFMIIIFIRTICIILESSQN